MKLIEFEDYYINPLFIETISPVYWKLGESFFDICVKGDDIQKRFTDEQQAIAFRLALIKKINEAMS